MPERPPSTHRVPLEAPPAPAQPVVAPARPNVLVIEHDRAVRTMQAIMLGNAGYDVLQASNGFSGLRLAKTHRPDAVVLDLVLPELDGCALIEALRTDVLTAAVPVVIVSAYLDDVDASVLARVQATLPKPFQVADLLMAVGRVLAGVQPN